VSLAYPICDTLLLSFAAALLVITGRLPGRAWALIILGLSTNALADAIYCYQVYGGSYVEGGWLDLFWPLGSIALAAASWQAGQRIAARAASGWRAYTVPGLFAAVITVRLLLQPLLPLAGAAEFVVALMLMAIVVRFVVTLVENQQLLARVEREPLTGLGNRGKLLEDLRSGLVAERPQLLTLFDLDGFKSYNDTFGHPAGDAMLARLGRRLADTLPEGGTAYRIGGDEFCVLIPAAGGRLNGAVERAAAALDEHGSGFVVTSSFGTAALPDEAEDPLAALQLADRRMYEQKDSRRVSAGGQAKDVLLQALGEREPELEEHVRSVSKLAVAVGKQMDLDPGELLDVSRAAELHDIGKVAIPDAILNKPGPLNEEEWTFMKQHTVLGEGIIASAPALSQVAPLVRSTHERFDGGGYPDGLAGEDIPLASRIIFACDAFDAMTTKRTYAVPRSEEAAIDELRSCAGSQFDPTVIDALCEVLRERGFGTDIAALEQALRAS
jgi:two-component system, cell cycle response regulator